MAAEDWLPFDYYDEDYDEGVTCKYCGEPELEWVKLKGRWTLVNSDGDIHRCKKQRSTPQEAFGR